MVVSRFNCPGIPDMRSSNCRLSKCVIAWDSCRVVFEAFTCAGIPNCFGGDGVVYWGCCCSWMMWVSRRALLIEILVLLVSSGAVFLAGVELAQSWTSCSLFTVFLSVNNLLSLPLSESSADDFVINSISLRAGAATCLRWSSSSCWISSSLSCVCFSISRRCLIMRRSASCCSSVSSLFSVDAYSRWRWLDPFQEVICDPDF